MSRRASPVAPDIRGSCVDANWMARAVAIAAGARPHPNPRVGAIVVGRDGSTLVAEARHEGPGRPHAETLVLEAAGPGAAGATLYVTLEPCVHQGQTPPCSEALIRSGIERVVVGVLDPDPRVCGRGIEALRQAGVAVEVGMLGDRVEEMDPSYFHHRRTGRPRITLKAAITIDGQLAGSDGSSRWITGAESRREVHELRAEVDAVVIGAGTLRIDDPELTVRLDGYAGPQPVPIVVAGRRPLPADARLLRRSELLVLAPTDLEAVTDRTHVLPDSTGERVDLSKAVTLLGERGLLEVLVEGGSALFGSLLRESLVDRLILYVGALAGGGVGFPLFGGVFRRLEDAFPVDIVSVSRVGSDVRVEALVRE